VQVRRLIDLTEEISMTASKIPLPTVADENLDDVFDRMAERYVKSVSGHGQADDDWGIDQPEQDIESWDPLYDIPLSM
jgi:hypothetical protein